MSLSLTTYMLQPMKQAISIPTGAVSRNHAPLLKHSGKVVPPARERISEQASSNIRVARKPIRVTVRVAVSCMGIS